MILSVVLYGYACCSVTQRDEHTFRVFERNVYKILFGKPEGRNHTEGGGKNVSIILKWVR